MRAEVRGSRPESALKVPAWVSKGRVPCLDGLRGVAILMVLGRHAMGDGFWAPDWVCWLLRRGYVGVDLFFVISGFLITLLLLRESDRTGAISLRGFYARRALRILPAMLAYLAFVAGMQVAGVADLDAIDWAMALTQTSNFHGPFGQGARPVEHLWSLSVEQHFYLLWPPALVAFGVRRAGPILVAVVLASPAIRMALWHVTEHRADLARVTPARLDAIAIGCLVAVVCRNARAQPLLGWLGDHCPWVIAACLAGVTLADGVLGHSGKYQILFAQPVLSAALAVTLVACVYGSGGRVGRLLDAGPLAGVGVISYSLYLWQQPFLASGTPWAGSGWPLSMGLTFLAACVSYWCVEKPFLALKDCWAARPGPRPAAALPNLGDRHVKS